MTGLFGGAFDPPHVGHVGLASAAKHHFDLHRLTILVAAHPAHKETSLPAETRLDLARAAFPNDDVRLDPHARTIDLLRGESFDDKNGFHFFPTGGAFAATDTKYKEVTATVSFLASDSFEARAEVRRDSANNTVFTDSTGATSKNMTSAALQGLYKF